MYVLLLALPAFAQDILPVHTDSYVLGADRELAPGARVWTAGTLVNLRGTPSLDAPVLRRLPAGVRARVLEDLGAWVEVRVGTGTGWVARELLTPMGRVADLDGDGVEERIVVAQTADGATRAWLREGAHTDVVTVHPWPDPYIGSWELVSAEQAGVPLLRVDLNQTSCGAYPSVWLSYTGDHLRTALEVVPWVDGGYGDSFEVQFVSPGVVSVREEEYGEIGEVLVAERACVLTDGVYTCG